MTEQQHPIDDTSADATSTPTAETAPPGSEDTTTPKSDSREAARYRRQLREVERERDQLLERVTAHRRTTVEQLAGQRMTRGTDVWLAEVELDGLLGDDGEVDAAKVANAVDAVLADRPYWEKPAPAPGFDGGARMSPPVSKGWAEVLRRS